MLDVLPMYEKVTLTGGTGLDDWGLPIKGEPVEVDAHYRYNTERKAIATSDGDEVVYTADIYLPFDTGINYDSTVEFIDDLGETVSKKPLSVQHKKDFWGSPVILKVVV